MYTPFAHPSMAPMAEDPSLFEKLTVAHLAKKFPATAES